MDTTRAVAKLPNLEIEILHRRLPDEDAEQLAISLKASPSFDAFAGWFEPRAALWPWPVLHPIFAWPALLQGLWSPWIVAAANLPAGAHRDRDQTS